MGVSSVLSKNSNKAEQRRFKRVALDLPARIIVNGIDEYDGQLVNISPGDLAVKVNGKIAKGDAAVIYVSGLDVIEGRIVRAFPDGFALSFLLSRRRRQLLTEQLMLKANGPLAAGLADRRAAPRHQGAEQRMTCRLPDGGSLFVRILDMSVDGVSVEAPRKPAVGSAIHVGRQKAIVLRHTARGFVALYERAAQSAGAPDARQPKLRAV
ncbi:MAG: PilZ domain-containing protein [Parvularculaceae bacterium]|nr:PilZ domain-containing protein [Parvularculaceae bacterium]